MKSSLNILKLSGLAVFMIISFQSRAHGNLENKTTMEARKLEETTLQDYLEAQELQKIEISQPCQVKVIDSNHQIIFEGAAELAETRKMIQTASFVAEVDGTKYYLKRK